MKTIKSASSIRRSSRDRQVSDLSWFFQRSSHSNLNRAFWIRTISPVCSRLGVIASLPRPRASYRPILTSSAFNSCIKLSKQAGSTTVTSLIKWLAITAASALYTSSWSKMAVNFLRLWLILRAPSSLLVYATKAAEPMTASFSSAVTSSIGLADKSMI